MLIDNPWGVGTVGRATVRSAPDIATAQVVVEHTEPTSAEAMRRTTAVLDAVRAALTGFGVPDTAVTNSTFAIRPETHWTGEKEIFVGHHCWASFTFATTGLGRLEELLGALVAAGAARIGSVQFDVSTRQELVDQARREAVADARRKARLYADAADVRLGQVVHVEELSPRSAPDEVGEGMSDTPHSLVPAHVEVGAVILVGTSILPG
ncbi:SIMPL domain-containing protein [Catellatospora tritici]|uniref:SIMPL domain-containing protein n=1 Tax=Catellatospora tritici TaxID=2851566 RepID=UPI001C2D1492|nr:SIMPL domain-containing protein [Catellatospora tritici]MBV1855969.1 SIMPL domain-containing protein [Catellatospora tritici]